MYLCIPRIKDAKIEEGIFVLPQIMGLIQDIKIQDRLSEVEKQHGNQPKRHYQYFWEIKFKTFVTWWLILYNPTKVRYVICFERFISLTLI